MGNLRLTWMPCLKEAARVELQVRRQEAKVARGREGKVDWGRGAQWLGLGGKVARVTEAGEQGGKAAKWQGCKGRVARLQGQGGKGKVARCLWHPMCDTKHSQG